MSPRRSAVPLTDIEPATRDLDQAVGLPPACFTDAAFYDFELAAIFDREWMCVGRSDQVPEPGDYFTATLVGDEPVLVTRTRDGEINVMSSICQHRGICIMTPPERPRDQWFDPVPATAGNANTFRCPYHWWIYDLEGRLVGAPAMQHRADFERSDISLPRLAVEEWQGFIFCSLSAEPEPLGPRLAGFDDLLANYHLDTLATTEPEILDMPFNWKVMAENFMDAYHSARLHGSLYDFDDAETADETLVHGNFSGYDPESAGIGGRGRTAFMDRGLNPTQRTLFPPIETLTDDERWHMVYLYVPPSLLLGISADSAFWFTVQPTSVASSSVSIGYLFPRSTMELKLFPRLFEQHRRGVDHFNDQDMPVNVSTQRGMASRFAPQGPLGAQDAFRAQFASWLYDRYRAAEEG